MPSRPRRQPAAPPAACEHGKQVIARNQRSITDLATQVKQASGIIQELEKNAQEINTILSTIQGIAEQTNLLALNAAIEAARAGEQGAALPWWPTRCGCCPSAPTAPPSRSAA